MEFLGGTTVSGSVGQRTPQIAGGWSATAVGEPSMLSP
jgi:hypothetical protein